MTLRSFLIISLCLVLAIVRIAGTHSHLLHHHGQSSDHATDRTAVLVVLAEEDSPLHMMSHLAHGDVDVDDSLQSLAKLLLAAIAPALILCLVFGLFDRYTIQRLRVRWPELRPPDCRAAFGLTPPSHAPPVLSLKA